jgi:hypothetical protein
MKTGIGQAVLAPAPGRRHPLRQHGYRADFNEVFWRRHLGDLDHGGGGRGRAKIFAPHFMNHIEVLHVAHVDVHSADVVERSTRFLDRGLEVLAHLAGLRLDVADAGDRAVGATRGHARDEHQFAGGSDCGRVGEMAARLAKLLRNDLLFGHGAPVRIVGSPDERRSREIRGCRPAFRCAHAGYEL